VGRIEEKSQVRRKIFNRATLQSGAGLCREVWFYREIKPLLFSKVIKFLNKACIQSLSNTGNAWDVIKHAGILKANQGHWITLNLCGTWARTLPFLIFTRVGSGYG